MNENKAPSGLAPTAMSKTEDRESTNNSSRNDRNDNDRVNHRPPPPSTAVTNIAEFLEAIAATGQVIEIRGLDVAGPGHPRRHTASGYFTDYRKAAQEALACARDGGNVYFTPNLVTPALLARAANRIRHIYSSKERLTSDSDIIARRWLLIDCDPCRPAGISSSDEEHAAALERVRAIREHLAGRGWPAPVTADSGNGGHLMYRVDLPTADGGLLKRCLQALALRFDDARVIVDQTTHNPARIWKLYFTMARKGDSTADRPHRRSRVLELPAALEVVPRELLEALAATLPKTVSSPARGEGGGGSFDLDAWISEHNLDLDGPEPWNGGQRWIFRTCPWNSEHTDRSAYLLHFASGAIAAGCHHNHCVGRDWHALRDLFEPGWRDRKESKRPKPAATTAEAEPDATKAAKATTAGDGKKSQANFLVELAATAELFHDPTGDTFARLSIDQHHQTWPTKSKGFKRWLVREFYEAYGSAPGGEAINTALGLIEAKAQFDGAEHAVHLRVSAEGGNGIYIDLGDNAWRAVHVTPGGWQIVEDPPVRFRRPPGLGSLPTPARGGRLEDLREFINVPDDDAWTITKGWLVAGLADHGPAPALALRGEQGSAKSTFARLLRALIDPATPMLRRPPRDERDLAIAARACWLVAFDNISEIKPWLSDALCALITGGGFATRELYSDFDEALFSARRPILLNGIEDYIVRGDLNDRAVSLMLPAIPEQRRREEKDLVASFDRAAPGIFGALLDRLSATLQQLPSVRLERSPRMADFARLAVAAEAGADEEPRFLEVYAGARAEAEAAVIESSTIGPALLQLCESLPWEGTASDLLGKLADLAGDTATKSKDWPKSPRGLSGELRRLAPALRRSGFDVAFTRATTKKAARIITITRIKNIPAEPSEPSEPSETPSNQGFLLTVDSLNRQISDDCAAQPSEDFPCEINGSDGSDGSDGSAGMFVGDDNAECF